MTHAVSRSKPGCVRARRALWLIMTASVSACATDGTTKPTPVLTVPVLAWRVDPPGGPGRERTIVPAASASMFLAIAPRGDVTALDRTTGAVRWAVPNGGGLAAPERLLVSNNIVLLPGDTVRGFDLQTGARVWSYTPPTSTAGCDPSVAGDLFIVCSSDWQVIALRATTGDVAWIRPLRDSLGGVPRLKATAAAGDTVYAVVQQDYSRTVGFSIALIFGIDRRSGVIVSRLHVGDYTDFTGDVSTPTIVGNLLIFPHGLVNKVTAIDRFTGRVVWRVFGDPGWVGFQRGPLNVVNGVIYGASGDRRVYAITAATGAVLWKSAILDGSQFVAVACGPYVFTWASVGVRILNRATGEYLGLLGNYTTQPVVDGTELFLQTASDFSKFNCITQ